MYCHMRLQALTAAAIESEPSSDTILVVEERLQALAAMSCVAARAAEQNPAVSDADLGMLFRNAYRMFLE